MPQAKKSKVKAVSAYDVRVRDCLVWPDPTCKASDAENQRTTYVRMRKGEVGRPNNRGFVLAEQQPVYIDPADEDHVIDALRGWPRSKVTEQAQQEQEVLPETNLEGEAKKSRSK